MYWDNKSNVIIARLLAIHERSDTSERPDFYFTTYPFQSSLPDFWSQLQMLPNIWDNLLEENRLPASFRLHIFSCLCWRGVDLDQNRAIKLLVDCFISATNFCWWGEIYNLRSVYFKEKQILGFINFCALKCIEFGNFSIAYFYPMLENTNVAPIYEPNDEDNRFLFFYNSLRLRYADYAAFFISQITNIPITFHKNYEDRARGISSLKTQVQAYCAKYGIILE